MLLADSTFFYNGVHSKECFFALPETIGFGFVEAFSFVLNVAFIGEMPCVAVSIPFVTMFMIAGATDLTGFNVDVNASVGKR